MATQPHDTVSDGDGPRASVADIAPGRLAGSGTRIFAGFSDRLMPDNGAQFLTYKPPPSSTPVPGGRVRMALWLYLDNTTDDIEETIYEVTQFDPHERQPATERCKVLQMQKYIKKIANLTRQETREFASFCVDLDAAVSVAMCGDNAPHETLGKRTATVALCWVDVPEETTFQQPRRKNDPVPDWFIVNGVLSRGLNAAKYKTTGDNFVCADYTRQWQDNRKDNADDSRIRQYSFVGSTQVFMDTSKWAQHVTLAHVFSVTRDYSAAS